MKLILKLIGNEQGTTLLEYGVVISVIGVALVAAVTDLGAGVLNLFSNAAAQY